MLFVDRSSWVFFFCSFRWKEFDRVVSYKFEVFFYYFSFELRIFDISSQQNWRWHEK